MDRLEQYIKDNRGSFDMELPPAGSRERFMARLDAGQDDRKVLTFRRIRLPFMLSAAAVAAVAALVITLALPGADREIQRTMQAMNSKEAEVIALVEDTCPQEMTAVLNSIRSITAEAIPFTDLLPDELPEKERVRIIKEYYGRKTEALQSLMACYDKRVE